MKRFSKILFLLIENSSSSSILPTTSPSPSLPKKQSKFPCLVCGKQFSNLDRLENHTLLHTHKFYKRHAIDPSSLQSASSLTAQKVCTKSVRNNGLPIVKGTEEELPSNGSIHAIDPVQPGSSHSKRVCTRSARNNGLPIPKGTEEKGLPNINKSKKNLINILVFYGVSFNPLSARAFFLGFFSKNIENLTL